jgi:23S rRNA pseudouridine1911/1915/1917 synthase
MGEWTVPSAEDATTLAAFLRGRIEGSWKRVKQQIWRGAVTVDGVPVTDPAHRLGAEQSVALGEATVSARQAPLPIVYIDAHVVVIDKPAGISTVPAGPEEQDTAQQRLRQQLSAKGKRPEALHKVHRIDKATSGLVMFARTKKALESLKEQLHARTLKRSYLCLVHGALQSQTITSSLARDRGDGLRGSTTVKGQGRRAVTHVEVLECFGPVTLCRCRLETGRTHQIRIHLAEAGHPLIGEPVYIRRFVRRGHVPLEAPRMMLHAAELGFVHPTQSHDILLQSDPPPAFAEWLEALRKR